MVHRKVFVEAIFFVVILSGCANMTKGNLSSLSKETETSQKGIAYREEDVSGFVVEYEVLKLSKKGSAFELLYIDPVKEQTFSELDVLAYFKLDIYNPTGKMLMLEQEVLLNEEKCSASFVGGNISHSSYFFYIPIPKKGEKIKSKMVIWLKDEQSGVETHQLVSVFKEM